MENARASITDGEANTRLDIEGRIEALEKDLPRREAARDAYRKMIQSVSFPENYDHFLDEDHAVVHRLLPDDSPDDAKREIERLRYLLEHGRLVYRPEQPLNHERSSILRIDFENLDRELIEHLSHHPEFLQVMHWRKFEELLTAIFRNQGYRTIIGAGSGDQGIDLRLIQTDSIGEIVTLVQAKRYKSTRPIDLEAVSALFGTIERFHANRGLFVTTSRYLPSATRLADELCHKIVLADSEDVIRWCRDLSRRKLWVQESRAPM